MQESEATMPTAKQPTLEIVGILPSPEAVENAVNDLTTAGWDRSELSLVAQHHLISDEPVGEDSRQTADDPSTDRQGVVSESDVRQARTLTAGLAGVAAAFVASGATILTGGTALTAVVGAAVLGGGAVAAVEGVGTAADRHRLDFLHAQLDAGGILLWIKLHRPEQERKARQILERHGATDVHVHPVPSEAGGHPAGSSAGRVV